MFWDSVYKDRYNAHKGTNHRSLEISFSNFPYTSKHNYWFYVFSSGTNPCRSQTAFNWQTSFWSLTFANKTFWAWVTMLYSSPLPDVLLEDCIETPVSPITMQMRKCGLVWQACRKSLQVLSLCSCCSFVRLCGRKLARPKTIIKKLTTHPPVHMQLIFHQF